MYADVEMNSFGLTGKSRQIEQLMRCEIIPEHEVRELCNKAREILVEESNVQQVDAPVTVWKISPWTPRCLIDVFV